MQRPTRYQAISKVVTNNAARKAIKYKAVIVTGTPGTGKTTLARRLAQLHSWRYVDVNDIIKECGLSEGYDRRRKCRIVDEKKLAKVLEKMIAHSTQRLVIDSHLIHALNPKAVRLCIVTKCAIPVLERRLRKKHYGKAKIEENIAAENMDICLHEAEDSGHRIRIVDTSRGVDEKTIKI